MNWTPRLLGLFAESFLPSAELKNTTRVSHWWCGWPVTQAMRQAQQVSTLSQTPKVGYGSTGGRGIRCQGYIQQSFQKKKCWRVKWITRLWFQIFFIFTPNWGRFPLWLIFFRWVETTNQIMFPPSMSQLQNTSSGFGSENLSTWSSFKSLEGWWVSVCFFASGGLSYMEMWAVIKVMINDGFFVFNSNTGVYFRPVILTSPQQ